MVEFLRNITDRKVEFDRLTLSSDKVELVKSLCDKTFTFGVAVVEVTIWDTVGPAVNLVVETLGTTEDFFRLNL